jgi:hypothetical protein
VRAELVGREVELERVWHEIPLFYFTNVAAVVGPYDPVPISPGCSWWDYELEVGAVIGREVANVSPDEAADAIAGFTIFGDWSARDLQFREMAGMLGPAKGKDGATTLGPMLVTVDELEPYRRGGSYHLEMKGYVNDELVSHGWMDQMDWSWADMAAFASRGTRLVPGEVIGSGTGWVERIVVDHPEIASFFTPLSICLNLDSFEYLQFDTTREQLLVYTLVVGNERVVLEFAPGTPRLAESEEQRLEGRTLPQNADELARDLRFIQMELMMSPDEDEEA